MPGRYYLLPIVAAAAAPLSADSLMQTLRGWGLSVAIPIEKNFGSGPLAPHASACNLRKSFLQTKLSSFSELEEDEIFELPSEGGDE